MVASTVFRRVVASFCRIALALLVIIFFAWAFGMRMPGRNISTAAALDNAEVALRAELLSDVQALAGDIGERNTNRHAQLKAAAGFIEGLLSRAGLTPRRGGCQVPGEGCYNTLNECRGTRAPN